MKIWPLLALSLALTTNAAAHHADAAFDHHRVITVSGTVRKYVWANPHVMLHVLLADSHDVAAFEGSTTVAMKHDGWTPDSLRVGDEVTVTYYPRRDGAPGGLLVTARRPDGTVIGPPPRRVP